MESKANYTLVGLVVLILIAALLSTALWLSVGFDKKKYNHYLVYLDEAASGLSEEALVKYNGVKAGFVKSIQLDKSNPQQVILLLSIEDSIPVTTSTYATLVSQGITGITNVGLSAENAILTPLEKKPGEPYPVIPSKPSLFNQLDKALKDVSQNINKVSVEVSRIFDRENAKNIKKTLANIERFSNTLAQNSDNIDQMLSRTNTFMEKMVQVSRDFPEIAQNLKVGVKKINEMATDVSEAGQSVNTVMKAGKITIEQISQQTLPAAIALLRHLEHIAVNFEVISSKMRQNPSIIVRGTTPPPPGPGE